MIKLLCLDTILEQEDAQGWLEPFESEILMELSLKLEAGLLIKKEGIRQK